MGQEMEQGSGKVEKKRTARKGRKVDAGELGAVQQICELYKRLEKAMRGLRGARDRQGGSTVRRR
jgi:hypothetical protein